MQYKNGFKNLAKKSMLILGASMIALNQSDARNTFIDTANDNTITDTYIDGEIKVQNQLILKLNPTKENSKLLAFHSSHRSHVSHQSHFSSSPRGGGGGSALPFLVGGGALLWGASKLISSDKGNRKK